MVAVLDGLVEPWELVLVNDGSFDESPPKMRALTENDPRGRVLNFGATSVTNRRNRRYGLCAG